MRVVAHGNLLVRGDFAIVETGFGCLGVNPGRRPSDVNLEVAFVGSEVAHACQGRRAAQENPVKRNGSPNKETSVGQWFTFGHERMRAGSSGVRLSMAYDSCVTC